MTSGPTVHMADSLRKILYKLQSFPEGLPYYPKLTQQTDSIYLYLEDRPAQVYNLATTYTRPANNIRILVF